MVRGYVSSATEQGGRQYQEDRFVVIRYDTPEEKGWLLAVMDGHGGSEVADLCEKSLGSLFRSLISGPAMITDVLRQLIEALVKKTRGMDTGSTISVVYISETNSNAFVAILGDSPVIIKTVHGLWVSPEHNIRTNEQDRKSVLENGVRYDGGYMCDPVTGNGLQLTRALGDRDFDKFLIREPEVASCLLLNRDSFVLVASDGLVDPGHNNKDTGSLVKIMEGDGTAADLVRDALRRRTRDNVTAVLWKQPE